MSDVFVSVVSGEEILVQRIALAIDAGALVHLGGEAAALLGGHARVAQWRTLEPGAREACQRINAIEDVVIDGDDRRKLVVCGYAG